jgi:hypothetical protein
MFGMFGIFGIWGHLGHLGHFWHFQGFLSLKMPKNTEMFKKFCIAECIRGSR